MRDWSISCFAFSLAANWAWGSIWFMRLGDLIDMSFSSPSYEASDDPPSSSSSSSLLLYLPSLPSSSLSSSSLLSSSSSSLWLYSSPSEDSSSFEALVSVFGDFDCYTSFSSLFSPYRDADGKKSFFLKNFFWMLVNYKPLIRTIEAGYRYLRIYFVEVPLTLLANVNLLHTVILLVLRPHMLR